MITRCGGSDPFRAAVNTISNPPGEYDRKVETPVSYTHLDVYKRQADGSRHPFDQFIIAKTPAARWGTTEDLVGPAVFLASDCLLYTSRCV